MDALFTQDGLAIATFKLVLENNGLLNSMMSLLTRILIEMPKTKASADLQAELDILRSQYEENSRELARYHENISLQKAEQYAAMHDSDLDSSVIQINQS